MLFNTHTPEVVQELCCIYRRITPTPVDVRGGTHSYQTPKRNEPDVGLVTAKVLQTNLRNVTNKSQQNVLRLFKKNNEKGVMRGRVRKWT